MTEQAIDKNKSIKDLVNTPFKKVVFVFQVFSWFLIVGCVPIGIFIGNMIGASAGKKTAISGGIFIVGEILFYATLLIIGKELIVILKQKFRKKRKD